MGGEVEGGLFGFALPALVFRRLRVCVGECVCVFARCGTNVHRPIVCYLLLFSGSDKSEIPRRLIV